MADEQDKKKTSMHLTVNSKGNIFTDQTPTPTRFIQNCEEVGLFQDLQNVNPFEETFRKATEAVKNGQPHLMETSYLQPPVDDTLHTPNVFPHMPELETEVKLQKVLPQQEPKPIPPPPRIYKYRSPNKCNDPVVIVINNNEAPIAFKMPVPKKPPTIKVYKPDYFARFSDNLQKAEGDNGFIKAKPGRKKAGDVSCGRSSDVREINRLAAIRTREKKKHYVSYLHTLNKELLLENSQLKEKVTSLIAENNRLRVNDQPSTVDQSQQTEEEIPQKDTYMTRRACFYSSIPETPPSDCFLRKPFKKRNLNATTSSCPLDQAES